VVEQASFIKALSLCELDWSCDLLRQYVAQDCIH
jgi:hypothetical protein